jgi:hypothetical protein
LAHEPSPPQASTDGGSGAQLTTERPSTTLSPHRWRIRISSTKGGATSNSLPRSSSMTRGTRLGFRGSYKKRIWSRRNSRSEISSTDKGIVCSAPLRRETSTQQLRPWRSRMGRWRLTRRTTKGERATHCCLGGERTLIFGSPL